MGAAQTQTHNTRNEIGSILCCSSKKAKPEEAFTDSDAIKARLYLTKTTTNSSSLGLLQQSSYSSNSRNIQRKYPQQQSQIHMTQQPLLQQQTLQLTQQQVRRNGTKRQGSYNPVTLRQSLMLKRKANLLKIQQQAAAMQQPQTQPLQQQNPSITCRLPLSVVQEAQKITDVDQRRKMLRDAHNFMNNLNRFLYQQHLKKLSVTSLLMQKYHYYEEIEAFVKGCQANVDDSEDEEHLVDGILAVIAQEKKDHHIILVQLFEFLTFSEILRLSRVNRKLYIVSGDTKMLRNNYMRKQEIQTSAAVISHVPTGEYFEQVQQNYQKSIGADNQQQYVYKVQSLKPLKKQKPQAFPKRGSVLSNQPIIINTSFSRENAESDASSSLVQNRSSHHPRINQQFDIILDRSCTKVELQNPMFVLNSSKGSSSWFQNSIGPKNWYQNNGNNASSQYQKHPHKQYTQEYSSSHKKIKEGSSSFNSSEKGRNNSHLPINHHYPHLQNRKIYRNLPYPPQEMKIVEMKFQNQEEEQFSEYYDEVDLQGEGKNFGSDHFGDSVDQLQKQTEFFQQQRRISFSMKRHTPPPFGYNLKKTAAQGGPLVHVNTYGHKKSNKANQQNLQFNQLRIPNYISNEGYSLHSQSSQAYDEYQRGRSSNVQLFPQDSFESMIKNINTVFLDETKERLQQNLRRKRMPHLSSQVDSILKHQQQMQQTFSDASSDTIYSQATAKFKNHQKKVEEQDQDEEEKQKSTGQARSSKKNNIFQSKDSLDEYNNLLRSGQNTIISDKKKKNQGAQKISIKDFLNIQLGYGAVLTVQTPGGTKTTIMPLSGKERISQGRSSQGAVLLQQTSYRSNQENPFALTTPSHQTKDPSLQQSLDVETEQIIKSNINLKPPNIVINDCLNDGKHSRFVSIEQDLRDGASNVDDYFDKVAIQK